MKINNKIFDSKLQAYLDFRQILMDHCLEVLKNNPKPPNTSQSLYTVSLALQVLEEMGNKFPAQEEIEYVEIIIKRLAKKNFSHKSTK